MVNEIDPAMMMSQSSGIADEMNSLSIEDIQNKSFMNYKIPPKLF